MNYNSNQNTDLHNISPTAGQRYILTEKEFWKINDLCYSLMLAIEKIILNGKLPRVYSYEHPCIKGFEKLVDQELTRTERPPSLEDFQF